MKYEYRAQISAKSWPGPKTKCFRNRKAMIRKLAELRKSPLAVYSAKAHGDLQNGDTLDGIQKEIELTIRILELESKVSAYSSDNEAAI